MSRPSLSIPTLFLTPVLFTAALISLSAGFPRLRAFTNTGVTVAVVTLAVEFIVALLAILTIPVLACVALLQGYRGSDIARRRHLRWPLWGTVTALTGYFLSAAAVFGLAYVPPGSVEGGWLVGKAFADQLPTLFLLLIPTTFAFAISKYLLLEASESSLGQKIAS